MHTPIVKQANLQANLQASDRREWEKYPLPCYIEPNALADQFSRLDHSGCLSVRLASPLGIYSVSAIFCVPLLRERVRLCVCGELAKKTTRCSGE